MKAEKDCTPDELERGVHVTTWSGQTSYTCIRCHFATLDEEEVSEHHFNVHILRPQLIEQARQNGGEIDPAQFRPPSVPLYDGSGNLILDKRKV